MCNENLLALIKKKEATKLFYSSAQDILFVARTGRKREKRWLKQLQKRQKQPVQFMINLVSGHVARAVNENGFTNFN